MAASEASPAPISIMCAGGLLFCCKYCWKVAAIALPRMGLRVADVEKSPVFPTVLILRA